MRRERVHLLLRRLILAACGLLILAWLPIADKWLGDQFHIHGIGELMSALAPFLFIPVGMFLSLASEIATWPWWVWLVLAAMWLGHKIERLNRNVVVLTRIVSQITQESVTNR
jgi:hypothetical protein